MPGACLRGNHLCVYTTSKIQHNSATFKKRNVLYWSESVFAGSFLSANPLAEESA